MSPEQDAEAILNKAWHYPEDAYAAFELLPGLVAEIKRLQASEKGSLHDFNQMVEQLAKWQQIAIEERANHLAATHVLTGMVPTPSIPAAITTVEDHVQGFREQAAQELGLEQEAIYVKRLEEKVLDFYECDATRRGCCRQVAQDQARVALGRIRERKK